MAQTSYTPISLYYSTTASAVPTSGNLVNGELALNITDGKIFYKDNAGVVQVIGTKGGVGTSSTTQVLYNSSGLVVGSANLTFNGTTLTTANDASISGLTVGKGTNGGSNNVAFGQSALFGNVSGGADTAVGYSALAANTTANYNTALGFYTLATNTTGASNTALGASALYSNTTASNNTAVGYQAGYSNTTGTASNYLGRQAGYTSNANYCTMMGDQAGYSSTGVGNTFFGYFSGGGVTSGTQNNFFGYASGNAITTGSKNSILGTYNGNQGGLDIRTASNYIVLSDGDGNPRGIFDASGNLLVGQTTNPTPARLAVGYNGTAADGLVINDANSASSSVFAAFTIGGTFIGQINRVAATSAVAYVTTSDYRLKENVLPMQNALALVEKLNPVTYDWIAGGSSQGFIAHELQAVVPDCVTGEKDAIDANGNPKYQGIDTSFLVATLAKAIQELKAEIDLLKEK